MKTISDVGLNDVQAVYDGNEGDLWELIMGQQIHIGGLRSSMELAERAGVGARLHGVDLCCCSGAGMRLLVRLCDVATMTGVDASKTVVERGRQRCREEGLSDRISFVLADVCENRLAGASADFVWGEDAWCYVADKPRLIAEAVRILKAGGVIAFTDWVEGPACLSDDEAGRFLRFMKFPNVQDISGYAALLKANGCQVVAAEDTGRFAAYLDLYQNMVDMQLTYDAMRIMNFNLAVIQEIAGEMVFMRELAHAGKIAQGRFIARRL